MNPGDIPLSPAETDVARGAWRRVRRSGVKYVDAGMLPDGMVELISTDEEALETVSKALCQPGVPVRRTQLPHPTKRQLAAVFDRAGELQPQVGAGPTAPVQLPGRPAMLQLPAGSGSEPGVGTALAVLGGGAALVLLLRAWK